MALYNNKSEILQAVKDHFSQPGAKLSKVDGGTCFYRQDQTAECPTRCAVGVLIPDNLYTPEIELKGLGEIWDFLVNNKIVPDNQDFTNFLWTMQIAHDKSFFVEEFLKELDTISL